MPELILVHVVLACSNKFPCAFNFFILQLEVSTSLTSFQLALQEQGVDAGSRCSTFAGKNGC